MEFTLKDKQFHHFAPIDSLVKQKDYHLWAGINIDTLNRIWMATAPAGIVIFDPENQSLHLPFPKDPALQQKISEDNFMIYCDRAGITWTGSWNNDHGIYQLISYSPPIIQYVSEPGNPNSLSSDFTVFCTDAGKGNMLIGTGDGLNIFDTKTGLFKTIRKNDLSGLTGKATEIQPIGLDTITQKAWIISDGFYQMDLNSKQCVPIQFKDSNNHNLIKPDGYPRPFKNGVVVAIDDSNRTLIFIGNPDSTVARQIISFSKGTINNFEISGDEDHLLFFSPGGIGPYQSYALANGKWSLIHTPIDSIQWGNSRVQ